MDGNWIISFIGDDRPGLVDRLSAAIREAGGNWQESQLSRMGGKFAGLIRIRLADQQRETLQQLLNDSGLDCRLTEAPDSQHTQGQTVVLTIVGPDRPGIVREVASELGARGINVQRMESHIEPAPMSSEALFHASITALLPGTLDRDALVQRLDDIAMAMTVEIDLRDLA